LSAASRDSGSAAVAATPRPLGRPLGTPRFFWRMIAYRPWLYSANVVAWTGYYATRLLPGLVAQAATARVQHYRAARQLATGRVTGALGEVFGAVQAVQVAGAEQRVVEHLRRLGEERRRVTLRERRTTLVLESVHWNTVNLGTGLILLLGAAAMRAGGGGGAGAFTVGDFALFVSYLGFATEFTAFAGGFLAQVQQVGVSLGRMRSLVPDGPAGALVEPHPVFRPPAPPRRRPAGDRLQTLEVCGLSLRHAEGGAGIEGVSLHLRRGTFTVITGPVGAGKTTLLRALLGLLPASAGEVRWNGALVADPLDVETERRLWERLLGSAGPASDGPAGVRRPVLQALGLVKSPRRLSSAILAAWRAGCGSDRSSAGTWRRARRSSGRRSGRCPR
jgi:ABC-type multidrug transport system fused ATPase/permease subunit